jgi:hypothetical protein
MECYGRGFLRGRPERICEFEMNTPPRGHWHSGQPGLTRGVHGLEGLRSSGSAQPLSSHPWPLSITFNT